MKIPKIKLSKKQKTKALMYGSMVVYAFGAAMYGAFNYLDGVESSWNTLTSKTNKDGNTFWTNSYSDDKDARYLMFGREATKRAWDAISAGKKVYLAVYPVEENEDEQEDS